MDAVGHGFAALVSTHSRLKAAGLHPVRGLPRGLGFNTQPPEGGWSPRRQAAATMPSFNTQPPEGGWHRQRQKPGTGVVSTHSRLKAAGVR